MMGRLDGKVAFVTAAGGAIAGATARLFAAEGAAVCCLDVVEDKVMQTASDIEAAGGRAFARVCDVTDADAVVAAMDETVTKYGKLDTVFNAAAFSEPRHRVADMPLEIWKTVIEVNLTGMFIVAKFAIPHMQRNGGGSLVLVSSIYGHIGAVERPAYCASKGGVRMLAKAIAVDYAQDNIRANAILPGPIETPRLLVRNASIEDVIERHGARLLKDRLGQPDEVAKTALFLASDESSFTSGADHFIDAGYTAI
jgi:NAD(P)-dependent dehydrogenase (short-subunit alcohol dehydrogenase family)